MIRRVQYPLQTSCSSVCGIFKSHAFTRFCGCGLAPHPKVPGRGRSGPGTMQGAQDPQWRQEGPSLQVPPLSAASPARIMRAAHAALESWRGISSRDPQRQRKGAQVANGRQRHGSQESPSRPRLILEPKFDAKLATATPGTPNLQRQRKERPGTARLRLGA